MSNLYIKNMVCGRCIMVVETELEKLGIIPAEVRLGVVRLAADLSEETKAVLSGRLEQLGFSLLDDKRFRLVEQVKNIIVGIVHRDEEELKANLSDHISALTGQEYASVSSTFSEVENTTIEKYYINQRIERAKELLAYDELTVKEISFRLNYSSPAHFSNQFKKVTGLTPNHFKRIGTVRRKPLDKV